MVTWIPRAWRDTGFRTAADVSATLAVPVLAAVPAMSTHRARRHGERRRRILFAIAAAGAAIGGGTAIGLALFR